MKRRIASLVTLAALLCLLCGTVQGSTDLVFVAVDDSIPLTLPAGAAPFYSRGVLYVPHTAFASSALPVFSSYNADAGTLVIFSRTQRLTFSLNEGTMTDEDGAVTDVTTFIRGGIVFLPVGYCASHFSFRVSNLTSLGGYPILRFTTSSDVYDDKTFVQQAENLIAYRVAQYQSDQPSVQDPARPNTPTTPGHTSPPGTQPPQEPARDPTTVYLVLTDAATMPEAAALLQQEQLPAAFFFTQPEIERYGPLIRQLQAAGYMIGVTVQAGEEDIQLALDQANQALELVCKSRTLLALLPEGLQAELSGYRVVEAPDTRVTATHIANSTRRSHLLFCTAENLESALSILSDSAISYALLRETSQMEP